MLSRRTLAAAVTLTSTLAAALAPAASAATATTPGGIATNLTSVNLLNINDFHGHIDDNGLALACLVQQRRKALGPNDTMLLSNGDNIGASPFVSASAKDLPTMAFLSTIGVRASSVGNHEFDKGLTNILGPVTQHESFPTLGANVYRKGTQTPALPEYAVRTINGVRVAVIGAVTADTPNIVVPDGVKGLTFGDPVTAVNRVATKLRATHAADVIVAEYHEGGGLSAPATLAANEAASPVFADIVTKTSPDVDVLVNAHTHQTYAYDAPTVSGTRPVIQSGSFGRSLAEIQLGIDPKTKKVVSYAQHNLSTKSTDLTTCDGDATYTAAKKIVDDAKAKAAKTGDVVIARQTGNLPRGEGESVLANLDAQAWLDEMNAAGRPGADIGIMNPGGVRSDLPYKARGGEKDGEITFGEAFAVNPFSNTMQVITLSGAQLKTLLEQQWTTRNGDDVKPLLGLSKNVHYTYDASKLAGQRITSITVNGKAVTSNGSYRVTSGSFIIGGGDGYTVLKEGTKKIDTGLNDGDVFVDWLKKHSPITPDTTHRGEAGSGASSPAPTGSTSAPAPSPSSSSSGATPSPTTNTTPGSTSAPSGTPTAPGASSPSPSGPMVETDDVDTYASGAGAAALVLAMTAAGGALVVARRRL